MNYKKLTALLVLLLFVCCQLKAQDNPYDLRTIVPPSPTVASLGKYGEIPVSLHTGVPAISIPLYEIKDGPLSLPISLGYHAAGIRVEEIASSVGLGWTLNAGGMVNRQIRGVADEQWGWALPVQDRIATILQNGTTNEKIALGESLQSGGKDSEADLYSYSMNGQSGKFLFDQAGTIFNYPAKNVSIAPWDGNLNSGSGWKIITEDGTLYEFTKYESVNSFSCSGGDQASRTAWFLTKIKSADGKRQITFTYEDVSYQNYYFLGQTKYINLPGSQGGCLGDNLLCAGLSITYTHRLKRIDFSGGYVKLNYNSTERLDLPGEKSLSQVEIYTSANTLIKKYDLAYSYFGAGSADQYGKRLKLTSVTEKSATGQKPPHEFTYEEEIEMPVRTSYAQDHWGYYNGKTSNSSLIPGFYYGAPGYQQYIPGEADRNANPATNQACILKKIKYPTGGKTSFTYETNTTADTRIEPPTYNDNHSYSLNQPYSSITSPYETTTFTIPSQGADVQLSVSGITASNAYCNYEVNLHCYLIKDNNVSTPFADITDASNGTRLLLPAGTYKFRFTYDYCNTGDLNFSISVNAKIPVVSDLGKRFVGGLRIKQIEDDPGNGGQSVIKKYRYNAYSDTSVSSGTLVRFPEYEYLMNVETWNLQNGECLGAPINYCSYIVKSSATNYPLASGQGSYVDYGNVTEDLGVNGEVQHIFRVITTTPELWPFPPVEEYDCERGSELSTRYYAKKNGLLVLSREIQNTYIQVPKGSLTSYKVGLGNRYGGEIPIRKVGSCYIPYNMTMTAYNLYPEFYALKNTTERLYAQNDTAKYIETETNYTYNTDHFQITQVQTSTSSSDGTVKDEILVNKKYPQDYTFTGTPSGTEAQGIKKLQDLHIVNIPIEQYSYRQNRNTSTNAVTNDRVVSGVITTFRSDNPYPDQVYRLETNTPIALSTYGSGSGLSSNVFIRNSNSTIANAYKSAVIFNSYDNSGNLTMQQKANDVQTSYLWGYGNNYPVAEVVGATYSTISALVNQAVLDNPGSEPALRNELNKVRTALSATSVFVTTYTYKPLVGISSVTDPNNRTSYYDYDAFGRVELIRDQDRNILKKYCYNYLGQAEVCTTYYLSVAKSGNFTRNNCAAGATPGTVSYSVPAGKYSSSISQADADQKAQDEVNANGQAYANANAPCTWYSVVKSGNFTRNNCAAGGTPGTVTYTVAAGTYSSTVSQAAADALAQTDVNTNGQTYANINATCTFYSVLKSGNFTRNNCGSGGTPGTVTYSVTAGTYNSIISQIDADGKAQNDVNTNGQSYANANATCTFHSEAINANYYKSNCPSGYIAQAYYVSIAAGTYTSTVSQAAANSLATAAAQAQADANGTCQLSNVLLIYNNSAPAGCYRVDMYNTSTSTHYYLDVTYTGTNYLGYVPPGTYNITIEQPYGMCDYSDRVFEVGCGNSTNVTAPAYFYSIAISESCKTITIY